MVVAGADEAWRVRPHPVCLVEHGAGQAYDVDDPGWSGGCRREGVTLFLCPNEVSAGRNRQRYPNADVRVVGSPRVEALRATRCRGRFPSSSPAVALSFHWHGTGKAPEAGWALPHYETGLAAACASLRASGVTVVGHGHPRAANRFRRLWSGLGVEWVEHFDDVVRRADVYVCDNSSTLFEAAACGIPVVVMNAPWYRRNVDLWPRFWRCADVGLQVDGPDELPQAVLRALNDPPMVARRRQAIADEVYGQIDGSAARAAYALRDHAASLCSAT